ncbi:uncharacterized protein KIAA1257-like [Scleropages formosus]|uniref:uncharacterized protein KIAA1257-like n=1 Tax=Scleropages formosus TaxID=113540 RepID=UPI00087853DE|nr:uncharacterized protein KIAA1257-like [Scleropages formosus]
MPIPLSRALRQKAIRADDWWALLDFESIRKSGIAGGLRLRIRLYQKQRLSDTMESSNSERGADPRESRTDFAQNNPLADEPECGSASGDEGKKVDDDSQEAERGDKCGTQELHTSEPHVSQAVTNMNAPRCETKSAESKSHEVTLTVSIAMALPQGFSEGEEDPVIAEKSNRKKPKQVLPSGVLEAPKAQSYYRIEFTLLPDDPEPMKFDLVMFGVAAKIYTDNETKVLMPWQEGDQVWLAWSHCVKAAITRDLVLKLASHRVAFRVWDTKDRLSSKARRDRPRTFRLQQGRGGDDADHEGGVKAMVQHLRSVFEMERPKCRPSVKRRRDSAVLDAARPSELDDGSGGNL